MLVSPGGLSGTMHETFCELFYNGRSVTVQKKKKKTQEKKNKTSITRSSFDFWVESMQMFDP